MTRSTISSMQRLDIQVTLLCEHILKTYVTVFQSSKEPLKFLELAYTRDAKGKIVEVEDKRQIGELLE